MEQKLSSIEIARKTYFWDRLKGAGNGLTETCWRVFALLVAIRYFEADESIKQFIPAGLGIGMLLSPVALGLANHLKTRISKLLACLWVGVALSFLGMVFAPSVVVFVLLCGLAQISASVGLPMQTHLYSANYTPQTRGSRLSTSFLIASFTGIGFGFLGGKVLDWNVNAYPAVFAVGILGALLCTYALSRIPSEAALTMRSRNPIRNLALAWEDRLFGVMLFAWMLMGLGNLMLIPIRVEYLANPEYGINATNTQISFLLISTVLTFRLLSTKIWGYLFDRINVISLRICLNLVFMGSIVFFFFTDRLWVMAIGCALLGTAFGGGGILWNLYVTKIAPAEKVSAYMSVHSFTTGLRMALAPFLGYAAVSLSHPSFAAWIALLMMGISTLIFIPLKPLIEAKAKSLDAPAPHGFENV